MKVCPICDAEAKVVRKSVPVHVPMAEDVYQEVDVSECPSCGAHIRVWSEEQETIEYRRLVRSVETIPSLLKVLDEKGYERSRIERALDLPAGGLGSVTVDDLKAPYVVAILRMLALEPFLVERMEEL